MRNWSIAPRQWLSAVARDADKHHLSNLVKRPLNCLCADLLPVKVVSYFSVSALPHTEYRAGLPPA
jgi:hypothetical protein